MGRYILAIGLFLAALTVGLTLLQRRNQATPKVEASSVVVQSVPAIRGKPAANFDLPSMDGSKVRLADFKDKVVLVNFWATWCAPCIVEIPWFIEFQKKYGPQGLEVVGISMDETGMKDVVPFAKKHGMTYKVLLGDEKTAEDFGGIRGLPTSFIVDREGKYYSMHRGLVTREEVEGEIATLLNKTASGTAASPATTKVSAGSDADAVECPLPDAPAGKPATAGTASPSAAPAKALAKS